MNKIVEAFNKVLEKVLTNICSLQKVDWDFKIPITLWAYCKTYKSLTKYSPFQLVYGLEVVVPMDFILPSLRVATNFKMNGNPSVHERLIELDKLDEKRFITAYNQHKKNVGRRQR